MNKSIKLTLKSRLVTCSGFLSFFSWLTRHTPKIFMLHRFTHDYRSPAAALSGRIFEKQLRILKKGPWRVMTLRDYLKIRLEKQCPPPYVVVLTIDDGYKDFYNVAYPLLRKYELPATFFVTTKFVNGDIWLWHDRIRYALSRTNKRHFSFKFQNTEFSFSLESELDRNKAWKGVSDFCIRVQDRTKWRAIFELEKVLDVSLPDAPTPEYEAVSWDDLRKMSANNIEIGSHTCNHPILSRVDRSELESEVLLSKNVISEQVGGSVYSFCYPNGEKQDVNEKVIAMVRQAGYYGAVQGCNRNFTNLYRLPRMGIGNDMLDFLWKLSGLELLLNKHE